MGPDFSTVELARRTCNHAVYDPKFTAGHYESFFQRANHPTRPLAFWIRYTVFSPKGRPRDAIGELWAIFFDGEAQQITAVKDEIPIADCLFARDRFDVTIAASKLSAGRAQGSASSGSRRLEWDLNWDTDHDPLFFFPLPFYARKLPKAKALVGVPATTYTGQLVVGDRTVDIDGWPGSQNHNWGSKHTDRYAWGQVSGFDNSDDTFLEVGTAQLKFGPLWTPRMTPVVLRHEGRQYELNGIWQIFRNNGCYDYFDWQFGAENDDVRLDGRIHAPDSAFVALNYYNPPGGSKTCLNSKIAACDLKVTDKRNGVTKQLASRHRAAFEILTDDDRHGLKHAV